MTTQIDETQSILEFWFGAPGSPHYLQSRAEWFTADPVFDETIRTRFGALTDAAIAGGLSAWESTPGGLLALILLTDQLSRNLYRGSARAFSGDTRARHLAALCVSKGWDRARHPIERVFIYLPFEHSEAADDQDQSVALFGRLSGFKDLGQYLHHAEAHRNVIRRFGRFPGRNAALGRASTVPEAAYLAAQTIGG